MSSEILKVMDDVRARQGRAPITNATHIEGEPPIETGPEFEDLPPALEPETAAVPESEPVVYRAQVSVEEPELMVAERTAVYKGHNVTLGELEYVQLVHVVIRAIRRSMKEQQAEIEKILPKRPRRKPRKKRKSE